MTHFMKVKGCIMTAKLEKRTAEINPHCSQFLLLPVGSQLSPKLL